MIVSLVYKIARRLLSVPGVLLRRDTAMDAELLVLRHENAVLRRQFVGPVRYEPADRFWLGALSSLIPRPRLTAHSTREWAVQQARNLAADLGTRMDSLRFLLRDRDGKYGQSFDAVFQAEETEILKSAPRGSSDERPLRAGDWQYPARGTRPCPHHERGPRPTGPGFPIELSSDSGVRGDQFLAGVPQHFLYLRPDSHQHGPLRAGGQVSVWSGWIVWCHSP